MEISLTSSVTLLRCFLERSRALVWYSGPVAVCSMLSHSFVLLRRTRCSPSDILAFSSDIWSASFVLISSLPIFLVSSERKILKSLNRTSSQGRLESQWGGEMEISLTSSVTLLRCFLERSTAQFSVENSPISSEMWSASSV